MLNILTSPPIILDTPEKLDAVLPGLLKEESLAVDTEANSMYAFKERVCLIQISTQGQDLIIDPLAINDLTKLGALFCDPKIEIIFHASEYDLLGLQRDHAFTVNNLFDTMIAARLLGYKQIGLANLLKDKFDITLNKNYQRADWGFRPLSAEMIAYAAEDTRYLFGLRNCLRSELMEKGLWQLAQEDFKRACFVSPAENNHRPCWQKAKGKIELSERQQMILNALCAARERIAEKLDRPVFKIVDDSVLLRISQAEPESLAELGECGLTERQLRRFGKPLLKAATDIKILPALASPAIHRHPGWYLKRMEKLKTWRKEKGEALGVESDVILPKVYLHPLAEQRGLTPEQLTQILVDSPYRMEHYGEEILHVLK